MVEMVTLAMALWLGISNVDTYNVLSTLTDSLSKQNDMGLPGLQVGTCLTCGYHRANSKPGLFDLFLSVR